jgi:hypothetical protein
MRSFFSLLPGSTSSKPGAQHQNCSTLTVTFGQRLPLRIVNHERLGSYMVHVLVKLDVSTQPAVRLSVAYFNVAACQPYTYYPVY